MVGFEFRINQNLQHQVKMWSCMYGQDTGALTTIIGRINQRVNIDVLENFLISSIEDHFGDDDMILQDYNVSRHRANQVKSHL